jgi:hypothetical protein
LQFEAIAPRGGSGTGSGGGTALFHGHGSSRDASTADVERYFRAVDRALCDVLRDRREPLVLAGVDYLLPLYRNLSRYGAIAAEQLTGNPEEKRDEELHREAWALMEPRLAEARRRAMARIQEALNTGQGSDRLTDVVPARGSGIDGARLARLARGARRGDSRDRRESRDARDVYDASDPANLAPLARLAPLATRTDSRTSCPG